MKYIILLLLLISTMSYGQDNKTRYHYYSDQWWKYHNLRDTTMERKYSDSMNNCNKFDARDSKIKTKTYANNKNK